MVLTDQVSKGRAAKAAPFFRRDRRAFQIRRCDADRGKDVRPDPTWSRVSVFGFATFAFVGGLAAGSFVTVVAHRVPRKVSIVRPRSSCPQCGTQIASRDNIPIFSWLLLRGHSRCCGESIPVRYPLTELAVAALFVATVLV